MQVKEKGADFSVTGVESGGSWGIKKGEPPWGYCGHACLSGQNTQDLNLGMEQDADMALVFHPQASYIHEVRKFLEEKERTSR